MTTMYDSVNVTEIPPGAKAVAGYVNGRWPTYWTLVTEFPHAHKISIAVDAFHDAECLDVERGDATPDQAPAWVKRQLKRGVWQPIVYTSLSQAQTLIRYLLIHGVKRSQFRLWTAHYTFQPHVCTARCGFGFRDVADATQYTDKALGRVLDATVCGPYFLVPRQPKPTRAQLRALILRWRHRGVSWVRIKATKAWRRFRALGGK